MELSNRNMLLVSWFIAHDQNLAMANGAWCPEDARSVGYWGLRNPRAGHSLAMTWAGHGQLPFEAKPVALDQDAILWVRVPSVPTLAPWLRTHARPEHCQPLQTSTE